MLNHYICAQLTIKDIKNLRIMGRIGPQEVIETYNT